MVGAGRYVCVLIAGVVGINRQMQYMRQIDLGVNIDQTFVIQEVIFRDSIQLLKVKSLLTELERQPGIITASASTHIPGKEVGNSTAFWKKGTHNEKRARTLGVDTKFIDNYGLKIIAGREFGEDFGTEQTNVILNETAVKKLGFESPEAAIGQQVTYPDGDLTVVGVLKDYHQESLRNDYDPIIFYPNTGTWSFYSMKVNTGDMPKTLAAVEKTWKSYFPGSPFQSFFLDDFYNAQYKADQQFNTILWSFTILAIIVACLGLLGLSAFTLSKKSKEISIRKVLGASAGQIVSLVTKESDCLCRGASLVLYPPATLAGDLCFPD